jgi:hypothetical protein
MYKPFHDKRELTLIYQKARPPPIELSALVEVGMHFRPASG